MKIPHKILTGIILINLLLANAFADDNAEPHQEEYKRKQAISHVINSYHDIGIFDGVVGVANSEKIIFKGGYGIADKTFNIPFESNTRVRLASVSKPFTSAIILILAEDGILTLDQTISDWLEDYPEETGQKITLSHLLSHSSGIPNYQYSKPFTDYQSQVLLMGMGRTEITTEAMIPNFSKKELIFEPGTQYSYSNSNYVLLQAIIEKATGQSFEDVAKERIWLPLNMNDTGVLNYRSVIPNLARGHVAHIHGYDSPFQAQYVGIPATGGIYSTVDDMMMWFQSLFNGKVFKNKASLDKLTQPVFPSQNGKASIGLGLFAGELKIDERTIEMIGHDGWGPPFTANLQYYPGLDLIVFAADNTSGLGGSTHAEVFRMTDDIVRAYIGQSFEPPLEPFDITFISLLERLSFDQALAQIQSDIAENKKAKPLENDVNSFGYALLSSGNTDHAIDIFTLNTILYPKSANALDSLAEAYQKNGNTPMAKKTYERALEIDPQNSYIRKNYEKLVSN